jgi:hypothetical protein
MPRRYSNAEIDEYVTEQQHRRQDARLADPSWTVCDDDLTPILGGGVWRQVREDQED